MPEKTEKAAPLKARIQDGQLMVALPMQRPSRSQSGKTDVIVNQRFIETTAQLDGKTVHVVVTAYVKVEKAEPAKAAA